MDRFSLFISLVSFIFLFGYCSSSNNDIDVDSNLNKNKSITQNIDTFFIKYYLDNPIDHSKITAQKDLKEAGTIDESKLNPKLNHLPFKLIYYNCSYTFSDQLGAIMKYSVFKNDSTWSFGSNGFRLYYFETTNEEFPLKKNYK